MDLLLDCGFTKPIATLDLTDVTNIIRTVALHKVILASLGELTDLKKGLQALGVGKVLTENTELMRQFYCIDERIELTSG